MTLAFTHPTLLALGHGHGRHHGGVLGLVVLVVIVVVAVILIVQRRRDRPVGETATPANYVDAAAPTPVSTDEPSAMALEPRAPKAMPPGHYRFSGLLRSEWTKLRSVRSTTWTLGIVVVVGFGLSVLVCILTRNNWSSMSPISRATFDPTSVSLIGILVAQFAIGVLGVLVLSAEYSTGTIRATFTGAPRRSKVLAAKILVFGVVSLVVTEIVAFVSYFVGQALLSAPATHTTISSPGALRAVAGSGLYVCLLGLCALGFAAIIRHTAGAVCAFLGVLLALPIIVALLPHTLSDDVQRFLPGEIGSQIVSAQSATNDFSPWVGMIILCAYAVALLLIGGGLIVRRDA